jgi:hypothetical protein
MGLVTLQKVMCDCDYEARVNVRILLADNAQLIGERFNSMGPVDT